MLTLASVAVRALDGASASTRNLSDPESQVTVSVSSVGSSVLARAGPGPFSARSGGRCNHRKSVGNMPGNQVAIGIACARPLPSE